MEECLLTVIVPCYNHEKYILQCLESIHNQTYRDFQWIVIDDGSRDRSPEILKEHQPRFGYELILQQNKGLSRTLTEVIRDRAKGKFISACASDDYWLPEKLDIQLKFMQEHPEHAMTFGKTYYVDVNSRLLDIPNNPNLRSGNVFEDILLQRFHPPVNYMYRKDALAEVGYFKSGVIGEDYYMNCLLASKHPLGFIDEFLGYYRVASIETKRDPLASLLDLRKTIELYKGHPAYKKAVLLSDCRSAKMLASQSKYKLRSLRYFIRSVSNFSLRDMVKYMFHMVAKWK